jgi:hypothetical protein
MPSRQTGGKRHGARSPQKHAPLRQVSASSPQSLPQLPQLSASFCVSMHDPVQQLSPLPHARPQVPQWLVLVFVFTQVPPQQV